MSDRNWGVGFAIIGASLGLAAYAFQAGVGVGELGHQQETYPTYQETQQNDGGPDATTRGNVETVREKQPCREPQGYNESDLCAQYRAANAASDAAYWARWQFYLSVAGVIGLGSTIFLTIRATNAAIHSNEIARDTAYRELRAYLSPGEAEVEVWVEGSTVWFKVDASVVNSGSTAAIITGERTWAAIIGGGGGGFESRQLAEIVAPRSAHTFSGSTGLGVDAIKEIRVRVGYLFTYTDYLGHQWTEVIWWRTDPIMPRPRRLIAKLILSSHKSGPDKELKWSEDELAEFQRRAQESRAGVPTDRGA